MQNLAVTPAEFAARSRSPSPSPATRPLTLPQKCDEQMAADGSCATCVRLRLQCLGFGAKRPEWLRVSTPSPHRAPSSHPPGEPQRPRPPREDKDLPRVPGHDQGPLRLGTTRCRARAPNTRPLRRLQLPHQQPPDTHPLHLLHQR